MSSVILIVVAALLAMLAVAELRLSRRKGMSLQMFVANLHEQGIPVEIASVVYRYYESFSLTRRLSISPVESRHKWFGSTDEDLLDDVRLILRRVGITASEGELATFATSRPDLFDLRHPEQVTFADIARFVLSAKDRFSV